MGLLKKPEIRDQIREFRRVALEASGIDANLVLASLKHEALFPRRAVYDRNGKVKPPHLWPPEVDHFLAGVTVIETHRQARDVDGMVKRDAAGRAVYEVVRE